MNKKEKYVFTRDSSNDGRIKNDIYTFDDNVMRKSLLDEKKALLEELSASTSIINGDNIDIQQDDTELETKTYIT